MEPFLMSLFAASVYAGLHYHLALQMFRLEPPCRRHHEAAHRFPHLSLSRRGASNPDGSQGIWDENEDCQKGRAGRIVQRPVHE